MLLTVKLLMLAAAALNFVLQAIGYTHMLQLNSYRTERYRKWCRENDEKLVNVRHLLPFLCIPAIWMNGRVPEIALYATAAGVLLLAGCRELPRYFAEKAAGVYGACVARAAFAGGAVSSLRRPLLFPVRAAVGGLSRIVFHGHLAVDGRGEFPADADRKGDREPLCKRCAAHPCRAR